MLKALAKRAFEKSGLFVKKFENLPRGVDWALDLSRIWGGRAPGMIFDVGANVGQTALFLKGHFPGATIHAFEPVAATFASLTRATRAAGGVACHRLALSDREGSERIATIPDSPYTSLTSDFLARLPDAVVEEIALTTLDRFCLDRGIGRIDLLKTDTEGHDLNVLRGASAMFEARAVGSVYAEVTFCPENAQNTLFAHVYDLLGGHGFRFMGLYEIESFQTKPWESAFCNALFVHNDTIDPGPS